MGGLISDSSGMNGGDGFLVDMDTLESAARALAQMGGDLSALSRSPASTAELGGACVQGTVRELHDEWAYALSQIEARLTNIARNMVQGAALYRYSDLAVSRGARP